MTNSLKKRLIVFLAVCTAVSFLWGGYVLFGKEQSIKYLPRNEKVEIVTRDLGITLQETPCFPAQDLFQKATQCNYCVNTLKVECPDCCLVFSPVRAIRCTAQADSKYPCDPVAFSSGSCGAVAATNMQSSGCGDFTPKPGSGKTCTKTPGKLEWMCEEDDLAPTAKACKPENAAKNAKPAGCPDCSAITPAYKIDEVTTTQTDKDGKTTTKTEYQYTLDADYKDCHDDCLAYTSAQEQCSADFKNCKDQTCGGAGFDDKCKNSPDPATGKGKCDERIDWPACDALTAADCVKMNNEANGCLIDVDGKCHSCFTRLNPDLFYRFVARSREKVTIMWQISSSPQFIDNAPTYFYTMVKITDENSGRVVHESIVNQKSFQGAFSIFSATAQSAVEDSGKVVLETGRPYRAEIYYFIPPLGLGLNIHVEKVQIIAVRTRH